MKSWRITVQPRPSENTILLKILALLFFSVQLSQQREIRKQEMESSTATQTELDMEWEEPGCFVFEFCFITFCFKNLIQEIIKTAQRAPVSPSHGLMITSNITPLTKIDTLLTKALFGSHQFLLAFLVYRFAKFCHMYRFIPPSQQLEHRTVPPPQRNSLRFPLDNHMLHHSYPLATSIIIVLFSELYKCQYM